MPLYGFSKKSKAVTFARQQRQSGLKAAVDTRKYKGRYIVQTGNFNASLRGIARRFGKRI